MDEHEYQSMISDGDTEEPEMPKGLCEEEVALWTGERMNQQNIKAVILELTRLRSIKNAAQEYIEAWERVEHNELDFAELVNSGKYNEDVMKLREAQKNYHAALSPQKDEPMK